MGLTVNIVDDIFAVLFHHQPNNEKNETFEGLNSGHWIFYPTAPALSWLLVSLHTL